MIEFTKGDMFAISVEARVNTVNCVGAMGKGVALAFKNRYPDMFEEYKQKCKEGVIRPGHLHTWKNLMGDWIINFPTKRDWKEPSRYEDIQAGLDELRNYLQEQKPASLALPALGCGNGGLDWNKVSLMIKEKLDGLDTHIFVFEPADSRNAGQMIKNQVSNDQITMLEELGFKSFNLPSQYTDEGLSPSSFINGDESLLNKQWLALLPSKSPLEEELKALDVIAHYMATLINPVSVALVYANQTTNQIIDIFLKHNISIVLILPFCPLTRKTINNVFENKKNIACAIVSIATPNQKWGKVIFSQSMTLLKKGAFRGLISEPNPEFLKNNLISRWNTCPIFNIYYKTQSAEILQMLKQEGVKSVGKKNLDLLFNNQALVKQNTDKPLYENGYFTASASQLRNIATAIERSKYPNVKIYIATSPNLYEKGFNEEVLRILERQGVFVTETN